MTKARLENTLEIVPKPLHGAVSESSVYNTRPSGHQQEGLRSVDDSMLRDTGLSLPGKLERVLNISWTSSLRR